MTNISFVLLPRRLEIRHYGEAAGSYRLYDDDGGTFAYEHGAFSWTHLDTHRDKRGEWMTTVTPGPNHAAWHYQNGRWTFMPVR